MNMPPGEKDIRESMSKGKTRFSKNEVFNLLETISDMRGTIAMHEANADEAALKAARREARIAELESGKREDLFGELAHANAFEELKRRDEELQETKDSVDKSRGAWLPHIALFCLSVVKNESVGLRFGHTAAALQDEWRRMENRILELEKEVKCCRKGEQE